MSKIEQFVTFRRKKEVIMNYDLDPKLINLWNLDGKKEAIMIAWNVIFGYPNIRILGYPEHFAIQVSKY